MAHILEFAKPDKTFTIGEVLKEKITDLAVRMADAKTLSEDPDMAELLESWRSELFIIRNAVYEVMIKPNIKPPKQPTPPKTEGSK